MSSPEGRENLMIAADMKSIKFFESFMSDKENDVIAIFFQNHF